MLRSHYIYCPSVQGSKPDSTHSVRAVGPACSANPVTRREGVGFPRVEYSPGKA